MTPSQLSRICTLLYGERWQSALARDLEINDRTVRRWAKEGSPEWADKNIKEFVAETISSLREVL